MSRRIFVGLMLLLPALWGCGSPTVRQGSPSSPNSITISPTTVVAGSADVLVNIKGSNFAGPGHSSSQAVWSSKGTETTLTTSFVSSTQLTAVVPANLLITPLRAQVFVLTGDRMGDLPLRKSDPANFSVTQMPVGVATIVSISPDSVSAGSPDVMLTIAGSNFAGPQCLTCDSYSVVVWSVAGNNISLDTMFVSSTQLTAVIPATLLGRPVTPQVFVQTWAGVQTDNEHVVGVTNAVTFSVSP